MFDFSHILQYSQKYLEAYYKSSSSNIVYNENLNRSLPYNQFHIHLIIRSKNDGLDNTFYKQLIKYEIDPEKTQNSEFDSIIRLAEDVQEFIFNFNINAPERI